MDETRSTFERGDDAGQGQGAQGDQVGGDATSVGNITGSAGVAIGHGARSYVQNTPPLMPTKAAAPAPPPIFVGRSEELREVGRALMAGQPTAIIALQGMGGIGKTALAQKICAELQDHFTGGIFWGSLLDYSGAAQPILRAWGRICAQDFGEETDVRVLADLVRGLLSTRRREEGPLLVVVDNVRKQWLEATKQLKQAVPAGVPVLLTLRDEKLAAALEAQIYRLEALAPDEGMTFLKELAGERTVTADSDAVTKLMEIAGYLPLAIELAGARLKVLGRKPGFQMADFTNAVAKSAHEALELPGHPGLAATFVVSYEALTVEQQQVFRWLGAFAPGLLVLGHISGVLALDPESAGKLLDELVGAAFLVWGEQPGTYDLHPLLRQYAVQLLANTEDGLDATRQHLVHFLAFAEVNQEKGPAAWDRLEATLADLLLAVETAQQLQHDEALRSFGYALIGNSRFLLTRGYNHAARQLLELMAVACQRLGDEAGEAVAWGNLGNMVREQGDYAAAKEYLQRALDINIKVGNLVDMAIALGNIGLVASDQGDHATAKVYLLRALDIETELDDSLGMANQLGNLGIVAINRGDYAEAEVYLQRSLEIHTQVDNLLGIARGLGSLGLVASDQGDYATAKVYLLRALDIHTQLGNRLGMARALTNLGRVIREQGDYAAAKELLQRALDIYTQLGNPLGMARVLGNLGTVIREQGDYTMAKEYLQRALDIDTQLGNRLGMANQLGNLGVVARRQGDYTIANEYHQRALDIHTQVGSPLGMATDLGNLGITASKQGDYAAAKAYFLRSAEIYYLIGLSVDPAIQAGLSSLD